MPNTAQRTLAGWSIVCIKGCGTFHEWSDIRYCPSCGALTNIRPAAKRKAGVGR